MSILFVAITLSVISLCLGEKFTINRKISENRGGSEDIINLKSYIIDNKIKLKAIGTFEIISSEPEIGNYFLLDSKTGQLKLRSHIDREIICKHGNHCRMTILISVDENVLEVVIEVVDVNDNIPLFPIRFKTLVLQENSNIGFEMSLPTAEDADSIDNGIIRYYIEDSRSVLAGKTTRYRGTTYFTIVEKTMNNMKIPYLKTVKEIDREEVEHFELILIAEDSGKQRGSCTIMINVADVNDNSPQWPTGSIYKKVRECESQGRLLELQAFDRDDSKTDNGLVKYKISEHSPKLESINRMFYIEGSNLLMHGHSLQIPETGNKISFFITALDGGGRENDTSVTIEIEDCNDHAPNIQLSKSSATVFENDKDLKLLTMVTVKDDDRDINSEFSCDLNDTSYLTLNKQHSFPQPSGGQMIMYQLEKVSGLMFDRERIPFYSIIIRCIDQGRPSMTSEKLFSISILDENDNPPRFPSKEVRFSITENNLVGAVVGYVKAIDADSTANGRVTYQIMNNDDNLYFTVNNYGKIEAKWKFDREEKSSYSLSILARDNGNPSLNDSCEVKIVILDVNDCLPTFKQQYFFQVVESNRSKDVYFNLGKVIAEDQDAGANGSIYYQIRGGIYNFKGHDRNSRSLIKISRDGTLEIYGIVDREKISTIQAEVIALDNGRPQLTSVTTVTIEVLDINDNKPKFKYPISKIIAVNVSMDTVVGTTVASFDAEDPDKGENGSVSYSIVGENGFNEHFPFQLQQDGRFTLAKNLLDRDPILKLPDRLVVRATDGGTPSLYEVVNVQINYMATDQQIRDNFGAFGGRKPIDRNQHIPGAADGNREHEIGDNMILLYVLAGVLFTVFLIVLLVLMYTYFSGRFIRGRRQESLNEKQLNNFCNDGPNSYECELLTAGSPTDCRDDFRKVSTIQIPYPTTEKGQYTHLMMNDSKYSPIQLVPNYYHSSCNPQMSQQPNFSQFNRSSNYESFNQAKMNVGVKNPNRLSNKWNSIENISQTMDPVNCSNPKGQTIGGLYNAHSYAAYINQFGKEDMEQNLSIEDGLNKMITKQQTLSHSSAKHSKEDQSLATYGQANSSKAPPKKCYVTSSFV